MIAVLYGETDATVWAGFRVACAACGRLLSALSRRTAPRDPPSDAAVTAAAQELLRTLGCRVGESVVCSYCLGPVERTKTRERHMNMDSWQIRIAEGQQPVSRGGWLVWDGDVEGDDDVTGS